MTDVTENAKRVRDMLKCVEREGINNLIAYLFESDFFFAPASTKYHRAYEGGLCEHSLNVTNLFEQRNRLMLNPVSTESVTLCGLLHDLCKISSYEKVGESYKGVKGHPASSSHARLSLEIIEHFIELDEVEKSLILFHMGLFGCYGYCIEYTPKDLHSAISRNPAVQVFAACDMEESKWRD